MVRAIGQFGQRARKPALKRRGRLVARRERAVRDERRAQVGDRRAFALHALALVERLVGELQAPVERSCTSENGRVCIQRIVDCAFDDAARASR